jgi:hypothetical protein
VNKKHLNELKDLYKALLKISELTRENAQMLEYASQSLDVAAAILKGGSKKEENLAEQFKNLNEIAFNWLVESKKKYMVKDYGFVFEKFIHN